jgi:peroxiredoxin
MKLPRVLAIALCGALLLAACSGKDAVVQGQSNGYNFVSANKLGATIAPADRKKAGDFTGTLLDGGNYSLSEQAGKVVVVNFWATWCGPCTAETPEFDSIYRQYQTKGVTFVGIDTKDEPSKAKAFVRDNQISYPIVFDQQGKTAITLGRIPANALPFTVLIDEQGRVAAVYLGAVASGDLTPTLNTLLKEQ